MTAIVFCMKDLKLNQFLPLIVTLTERAHPPSGKNLLFFFIFLQLAASDNADKGQAKKNFHVFCLLPVAHGFSIVGLLTQRQWGQQHRLTSVNHYDLTRTELSTRYGRWSGESAGNSTCATRLAGKRSTTEPKSTLIYAALHEKSSLSYLLVVVAEITNLRVCLTV